MIQPRLKAFIQNRNTAEGFGFIIFSLIMIAGTYNLSWEAALIPRLMALIIMIMGMLLILSGRKDVSSSIDRVSVLNRKTILRSILLAVVLLIFWILQQVLGFYCASFFLFCFLYFFFDPRFTISNMIIGLGFSIITIILFYSLFFKVMRIMTPTGLLI